MDDAQQHSEELDKQTLLQNSINKMIDDYMTEIDTECTELKNICSNFNIVDELNDLIYQLKQESKTLTSLPARELADTIIKSIEEICERFA